MHAILGTMTFGSQVNLDDSAKMVTGFINAGYQELDSAYVYNGGKTEEQLGDLNKQGVLKNSLIATKVNPKAGGLGATSVNKQFTTSLQRMGLDSVDLLYLHQPDPNVPVVETLEALQQHHQAGRFKRLGLSNYASWQVAEISEICQREGWMKPEVYQGMYNAVTRDVERELFLCLNNYNISFFVYNPLAGGMLSGKHQDINSLPDTGRFDGNAEYQKRYWKPDYFNAVNTFTDACKNEDINPASAALRWLVHHSDLQAAKGDGIIIGASSQAHFEQNIEALTAPALPDTIISALDHGWEMARPDCVKYFRP